MNIHTINLASKELFLKVITSSFYKNLKMEVLFSVNNSVNNQSVFHCSLIEAIFNEHENCK